MNNSINTPTSGLFTDCPNEKAIEFILTSHTRKFFPTLVSVDRAIRRSGDEHGFSSADAQEVLSALEKMFSSSFKRFFIELGDGQFSVNVERIQRELSVTFRPSAKAELSELTISRPPNSKNLITNSGIFAKNFTELFLECMRHAQYVDVNAARVLEQFLERGRTKDDFFEYKAIGTTAKKLAAANVGEIKPYPALVYVTAWGSLSVETIKGQQTYDRLDRMELDIVCEFTTRLEAEKFAHEAEPHWRLQYERNRIQERIEHLERELEAERKKLANA